MDQILVNQINKIMLIICNIMLQMNNISFEDFVAKIATDQILSWIKSIKDSKLDFIEWFVIQTAVYNAERFVMQWNFFDLKNPRFIIESGFKSRAGYNGARTVHDLSINYQLNYWFLNLHQLCKMFISYSNIVNNIIACYK